MTEADKKKLDRITEQILKQIDEKGFQQTGAFNLRHNGIALCHGDSEHIKIRKKEDKPGIDVYIDGDTKGEQVHIPVVVDASGMTDIVYNDFYIAEGADVTIIAGCGIHNSGCNESRHDGIHSFHVGKGANVRYEEKHYGEGEGTGARVLNPVTKIYMEDDSVFTLDTAQIKGVDSTVRETDVHMGPGSKLYVLEKLMTHDQQTAESNMEVDLDGEGSSAQIISRSVAKEPPGRCSIQRQLEIQNVTHISSVTLSLWIMHRWLPSPRLMPGIWMRRSSMRRRSEGSMTSSL